MRLGAMAGASGLGFQWGSTIKSPWVNSSPHHACPISVKHSFIPQQTTSGAIIVAVLWPVPFPKCASSNYKADTSTMTWYSTQSHIHDTELTSSFSILLMPTTRLESDKYVITYNNQWLIFMSLVWLDREPNSRFPADKAHALLNRPTHPVIC